MKREQQIMNRGPQTPCPARAPEPAIDHWLSPKEVAAHFGMSLYSSYRWINEGYIPPEFVRCIGRRRIRIHPDSVALLEKTFAEWQDR